MWALCLAPFAVHAAAFFADEILFHWRRGLPAWERVGHPLDTLSTLLCFLWIARTPFAPDSLSVFVVLSILSCLLVTKDEFVHARLASPAEHWVHALLLVLHPVLLGVAALVWSRTSALVALDVPRGMGFAALRVVVGMQPLLLAAVFLYQVLFWGILWNSSRPVLPER